MRIYTRSGDDGTTGLIGGSRVAKSDLRVRCLGALDELNAAVGLARAAAPQRIAQDLRVVQNDLLALGAHLAAVEPPLVTPLPQLDQQMIALLEGQIDAVQAQLPLLEHFILPDGSEAAARLHLARAICRRAEREVVALARAQQVNPLLLAYLNRLADWLFVMARLANLLAGVADEQWPESVADGRDNVGGVTG